MTYSINIGQPTYTNRKPLSSVYPDMDNILFTLPDNVDRLISPDFLRDAIYTVWASSAFKFTESSDGVKYVGVDSGNINDRSVSGKFLIGKRSFSGTQSYQDSHDVLDNTLLGSDVDIFLYNTKRDTISQNNTRAVFLTGINNQFATSPYIQTQIVKTQGASCVNFSGYGLVDEIPFTTIWDTTQTYDNYYHQLYLNDPILYAGYVTTEQLNSSNSNQIQLPLFFNGEYDFEIDWGDGTVEKYTNDINNTDPNKIQISFTQPYYVCDVKHTYSVSGEYTVKIKGKLKGWGFKNEYDKLKFKEVKHWGCLELINDWQGNANCFHGCENMTVSSDILDTLNISNLTHLNYLFSNCKKLNYIKGVEGWDLSHIQSLYATFQSCLVFNADLTYWNISNVTNLGLLFNGAILFNNGKVVGVGGTLPWDTSNVTVLYGTFAGAESFNQYLPWDTSKVTDCVSLFYWAYKFNNGQAPGENTAPLNWDVSSVTNFSNSFQQCVSFNQPLTFNGNKWDVSLVTSFYGMLNYCVLFNHYVGDWEIRNDVPVYLDLLFLGCASFNNGQSPGASTAPLNWDVSSVISMWGAFAAASSFNQPLPWNTISVTNIHSLFYAATLFNQPLNYDPINNYWDTSNVINMWSVFSLASSFNNGQSPGVGGTLNWNTQSVINMREIFHGAIAFNQYLPWNTSNVTDLYLSFYNTTLFNNGQAPGASTAPLNWDTSNVTNLYGTFASAISFNQSLSWNTSKVTRADSLFYNTTLFNNGQAPGASTAPLNWDTSNVEDLHSAFNAASSFNQDLPWDTSKVTNMRYIFGNALLFNRPLNWDVSKVETMSHAFANAIVFNQSLANWTLSSLILVPLLPDNSNYWAWAYSSAVSMLFNCGMDTNNYDATIIAWAAKANLLPDEVFIGVQGRSYSNAALVSRTTLVNKGWEIVGDSLV
jgi:hypothetical protein